MNSLTLLMTKCTIINFRNATVLPIASSLTAQLRHKTKDVDKPKPGDGRQYRRIIHFPKEYTIKPLDTTHLAGRDPVTGRVVAKGIGGGIKHKYHWIKWVRDGPSQEGEILKEIVIEIMEDGCRTAKIALVGHGDNLKYILATENMKAGDIIKTSRFIPRIPGIFLVSALFYS